MSNKIEAEFASFNGIGNGDNGNNTVLPIQTLPQSQKTRNWKQATIDALERIGVNQLHKNIRFRDYRKMTEGRFTYSATGFGDFMEMPWFDKEIRQLRQGAGIPTYIKHFDFIGIVVNALTNMFNELDDRYRVESIDEYSTNEFIRMKTEMLYENAQRIFMEEINRTLLMRGIDMNKSDFQSEEEAQQYQQEVQQQVKALTPMEIEKAMQKNFKVLATEWAQNTLTEDKKRFYLEQKDKESFIDYLLSGRCFRHYRVGYDTYDIENWKVEETFFSQDVDARYPQHGEYVGRITSMSISEVLNKFGYLMTTKEQEAIGNYWRQTKDYNSFDSMGGETISPQQGFFPKNVTTPFHNYFDHQINVQLEDALGVPLGVSTRKNEDGEEIHESSWIPRMDSEELDFRTNLYSRYLRDDIEVRHDTVRVTEVYWRSMKRIGILIFRNEVGALDLEITTDDLLPDFLEDNEIKKLRNISLEELKYALKEDRLEEYENTISYHYVPEVWKGIKIKGNGSTMKKDMYLDVKPLDYQIRGDSNIYDVQLPVTGLISNGIATKLEPYQQLHNICMNQITELLEKELGVIFVLDITGLSEEYQNETTEDAMFLMRELVKDTGLLPLDLSRQNTQGNSPNVFQRQEIVYAQQVQYRWQLAQQYKQEALAQIGITPQVLGQPLKQDTAEGVKQTMNTSYTLIDGYFDEFNDAKIRGMEVHLAIAQFCQANGKDGGSIMYRKSDGDHYILDIMREDGEIFPLRKLGVIGETSSKDRKIVEQFKQFALSNNTIAQNFSDVIELLTNPVLVELKDSAEQMRKRNEQSVQEQRQFEAEQQDKLLQSQQQELQAKNAHEENLEHIKGRYKIQSEQLQAYGRLGDKQVTDMEIYDRLDKQAQIATQTAQKDAQIANQEADLQRKIAADSDYKRQEMEKLRLQALEIKTRQDKIKSDERIALYNKN